MSTTERNQGACELEACHLYKTYKRPHASDLPVLRDVSLRVAPGERVAILGKSGSGKSTLLNILGGLDRPDPCQRGLPAQPRLSAPPEATEAAAEPQLLVGGVDLLRASEAQRARLRPSHIGFVFQSFHLLPDLTVEENVLFPTMAVPRKERGDARTRARLLLEQVGLADRLRHRPNELSGGEQQRVAIARALINTPRIILADEPTGNLDPLTGQQILDLIVDLSDLRSTHPPALVMVTHSDATAARCTRVLHLENGAFAATTER